MTQYLVKLFLSAAIIVVVSETAKRSTLLGGIVASLPITSVLAMIWLYAETKDTAKVAALSTSILWLVLPSLTLFLTLPWLLGKKFSFPLSLTLSIAATALSYFALIKLLVKFGIEEPA